MAIDKKVVRARIRRALQASAAPAYALILVRVLDAIQRADFLGRMMGAESVLTFVRDWGWIVGVAWIAYLILAPSRSEISHAVNAQKLRRQLVLLMHRIERLSLLYEMPEFDTSSHRLALEERRRHLLQVSVANLLEYVLAAVPEKHRPEYQEAVVGASIDLIDTPKEQLSLLSREQEVPITSGLDLFLEWHRDRSAEGDQES